MDGILLPFWTGLSAAGTGFQHLFKVFAPSFQDIPRRSRFDPHDAGNCMTDWILRPVAARKLVHCMTLGSIQSVPNK
jgi:hypothetical protein